MGGGLGERRSLQGTNEMMKNCLRHMGHCKTHCGPNIPLLLSLQQLPVSTYLHIQSQLDIQELLVLVQLLLHLLPHLGHFSVFLTQQTTCGVSLPRQGILQVPDLRFAGRQLDHKVIIGSK